MTNVIDALKRLERHGAEHSKTTQKLKEAAAALAEHVASSLPRPVPPRTCLALPRDYWLDAAGLVWQGRPGLPSSACLRGDSLDRNTALQFARDIAEGWLDEVAEWLSARTQADEAAAAELERAAGPREPD